MKLHKDQFIQAINQDKSDALSTADTKGVVINTAPANMATQAPLFTHRYSASSSSSEDTGVMSTRRDMAAARAGLRERQLNLPSPSATPRLDAWRRSQYGAEERSKQMISKPNDSLRNRVQSSSIKHTGMNGERRPQTAKALSRTSTLRGAYETILTKEQQGSRTLAKKVSFEDRMNTTPSSEIDFRHDGPDTSPSPAARVRVWGSKSKVGSSWLQRNMESGNAPRVSAVTSSNADVVKRGEETSARPNTAIPIQSNDWDTEFTEASIEVSNSPRLKPSTYLQTPPRTGLNIPNGDTRFSPPADIYQSDEQHEPYDKIDSNPNIPLSPIFKASRVARTEISSGSDYDQPLSPLFKDEAEAAEPASQLRSLSSKATSATGSEAEATTARPNSQAFASGLKRFERVSDRRPLFEKKEQRHAEPRSHGEEQILSQPKASKLDDIPNPNPDQELPIKAVQTLVDRSSKLGSTEIAKRLSPEITTNEIKRRQSISQLVRRQSSSPVPQNKSTDSFDALRDLSRVLSPSPDVKSTAAVKSNAEEPRFTAELKGARDLSTEAEGTAEQKRTIPSSSKDTFQSKELIIESGEVLKREQSASLLAPTIAESVNDNKPAFERHTKSTVQIRTTSELPPPVAPKLVNTAIPASASEDVRQILAEMDAEAILTNESSSGSLLALNSKLQHSLASIRESKKGIEAMESTIATTAPVSTPLPSAKAALNIEDSEDWASIPLYRPRIWKQNAQSWLDLTWFAWVLLTVILWFNAEDFAHCCVGRMDSLGYYEPIDPERPEWGWALPYLVKKTGIRLLDLLKD